MYFTRYIWFYIRKLYLKLKLKKKKFNCKRISKFPHTYLPYDFRCYRRKILRKFKIFKLKKFNLLLLCIFGLIYIYKKYLSFNNYKLKYKLNYNIIYDLYFNFKKLKLKYRLKKYRRSFLLHIGKKNKVSVIAPRFNLTLAVLTETVTYGSKKKKKKIQKKKNTKKGVQKKVKN